MMRNVMIVDILRKKESTVHTVHPETTVHEAILELVDKGVGALVVTDRNEDVVGIITERDILRENARKFDHIDKTRVAEIMTRQVTCGNPDQSLDDAMFLMTQMCIRHLPILHDSKLIGMISIGDLVKSQLDEAAHEIKHLHNYITGAYPA